MISFTISHCVAAGSGIPRHPWSRSRRWKGSPLPYFSSAIMLALVSSYFSAPTPSGGSAVNTSVQRLHRNFSSSYTVAFSAAWPTTRTSTPGCAWW